MYVLMCLYNGDMGAGVYLYQVDLAMCIALLVILPDLMRVNPPIHACMKTHSWRGKPLQLWTCNTGRSLHYWLLPREERTGLNDRMNTPLWLARIIHFLWMIYMRKNDVFFHLPYMCGRGVTARQGNGIWIKSNQDCYHFKTVNDSHNTPNNTCPVSPEPAQLIETLLKHTVHWTTFHRALQSTETQTKETHSLLKWSILNHYWITITTESQSTDTQSNEPHIHCRTTIYGCTVYLITVYWTPQSTEPQSTESQSIEPQSTEPHATKPNNIHSHYLQNHSPLNYNLLIHSFMNHTIYRTTVDGTTLYYITVFYTTQSKETQCTSLLNHNLLNHSLLNSSCWHKV